MGPSDVRTRSARSVSSVSPGSMRPSISARSRTPLSAALSRCVEKTVVLMLSSRLKKRSE